MGLSLPHLIVLALVVLVLFGRGRISEMMGDFGKGIKSFKDGMTDETTNRQPPAQAQIPPPAASQAPQAPAQSTPTPTPTPTPTLNGETIDPGHSAPR
jgi:sec-independent protein translocase protein TatA